MPESVTDRFSGRYEHVFLFSKQQKYWFDLDPLREKRTRGDEGAASAKDYNRKNPFSTKVTPHRNNPESVFNSGVYKTSGKNPGDVWCIPTTPFAAAHFAVYPVELAQRAILAGCRPGGTVLDPFTGSGTTGRAALNTKRRFIGIDLNADYLKMSLTHPHRFGKAPQ
jgi:site-specific DNA-methyltransferase (cytosine-N4-specific)